MSIYYKKIAFNIYSKKIQPKCTKDNTEKFNLEFIKIFY